MGAAVAVGILNDDAVGMRGNAIDRRALFFILAAPFLSSELLTVQRSTARSLELHVPSF